jgi:UDP-N-acetylglucosamine 2-epimerase (non-hydrolysing)
MDSRRGPRVKVAVVIGTRPEAIKMAPVVRALRAASGIQSEVVLTAQHRELLDQALEPFEIRGDRDLNVMQERQTLPQLSSRLLTALDGWLETSQPDLVLVQGDTTTAFVASLASFYRGAAVGHIEAGLRTPSAINPFPEEMNRRLVSRLALLHFAPTRHAEATLIDEGVDRAGVFMTGNTVVDALQAILRSAQYADTTLPLSLDAGDQLVLVTMHRRESWDRIDHVCSAITDVLAARPRVKVLFPVHPNPVVRESVRRLLGPVSGVRLVDPLAYLPFVKAMAASRVILTDSGGVQEEAPVLGRPVLVLRDATERPEAIDAGVARLVGTDRGRIVAALSELLDNDAACAAMSKSVSPFGDGRASEYIARIISEHRDAILAYAQRAGNPRRRATEAAL